MKSMFQCQKVSTIIIIVIIVQRSEALFIDLPKTFDTADLQPYIILAWLSMPTTYQSTTECVQVADTTLSSLDLTKGVPQGLVLGHYYLLF